MEGTTNLPRTVTLAEMMNEIRKKYASPSYFVRSSLNEMVEELIKEQREQDLLGGEYQLENGIWAPRIRYEVAWDAAFQNSWVQSFANNLYPPGTFKLTGIEVAEPEQTKEPEFEVNLAEALVGWRVWELKGGQLYSVWGNHAWEPLEALSARCDLDQRRIFRDFGAPPHGGDPVREDCSCGIYAKTSREALTDELDDGYFVLGEVYGWGRYIRGNKGWRAQFAYPKSFYIKDHQRDLISILKKYQVPIYLEQPIQIYSPEEEGYSAYRQDSPDWNRGTVEEPGAAEDYYEEDDYEEDDE